MHYVKVEVTNDPIHDTPKDGYEAEIPIFYPHELLRYLFEEVGIVVPAAALSEYWSKAKEAGLPWATRATEERIPLKLFADDAQVNDQGDKVFAFILSCPLYRPKSSRNSKWPVGLFSLQRSVGWPTLRPFLAELVYSLNIAYDQPISGGRKFQVTEIGMDWKALRECFKLKSHWNSHMMCHMCRMSNKQYADLPENLDFRDTVSFLSEVLPSDSVSPLILLRAFDVSCITWCSLHNLNLGLLWTLNGGTLAHLVECGTFGDPQTDGVASCLRAAYKDFKQWQSLTGIRCSQRPFTMNMVFKASHGAYLTAKGFNSRCIAAFLADKSKDLWQKTANPSSELTLQTNVMLSGCS